MANAQSYASSYPSVRQFAALVYLFLGVQGLHAENIYVPLIVETIPPAAVVAVANHPDEQLLSDGTRIYLSDTHRAVIVESHHQKKEYPLFGQYSISEFSLNNSGLLLAQQPYVERDRKFVYFDFKTQKRTVIQTQGTLGVSTYSGDLYLTDNQHVYLLNRRTGGMVSFPHLPQGTVTVVSSNKNHFVVSDSNTSSQNVISMAADGSSVVYPVGASSRFSYCDINTAQLLSCDDSGTQIVFASSKTFRLPKDWTALGLTTDNQSAVVYTNREKSQIGLYDLRTNTMRTKSLDDLSVDFDFNLSEPVLVVSVPSNPIMSFIATYVTSAKATNHLLRVDELAKLVDIPKLSDKNIPGRIISDAERESYMRGVYTSDWVQDYSPTEPSFHRASDPSKRYVIANLENYGVGTLGNSGFITISTGVHRNYTLLFDLSSRRIFELGDTSPMSDYNDSTHTYRATYPSGQVLINLDHIRSSASHKIELGSKERAPHSPLPADLLTTCDSAPARVSDPIIQRLLALRANDGTLAEDDLRDLLRYHLDNSELILVAQIFQRALLTDPSIAEPLFRQTLTYDRLESLAPRLTPNPCLDDSAESAIREHLNDLFNEKSSDGQARGINFTTIATNIVYGPYIRKFGLATEAIEDALGDRLATGAQAAPLTESIFYSKLYYFARAAIEPIFGRARTYKTDFTAIPQGSNVQLLQISSYPSHGLKSRRSSFGFFLADGGTIQAPGPTPGSSATQSVDWQAAKTSYRANVKVTVGSNLQSLVPPTSGLDYKAIRGDGKITGLMVVGYNLHEQDSQKTLTEYQSFYNDRGYSFDVFTVEDFPNWFKDHIANGDIDYLIKEAHSDGDEKNIFRASTRAHVLVGRKASTKFPGVQEVIYLAAPIWYAIADRDTQLIPNQMFGEWIRAREAGGHGPLVYINSSCSSYYKVLREITAAHSKALVAIPSVTMVSEFRNQRANVTSVLIDGILQGQDWSTIRGIMKARQPDINQDHYVLPNEPEFDSTIRAHLSYTLDTEVHVWDLGQNREVNVDQFNAHND